MTHQQKENIKDKPRNPIKPLVTEDYNIHRVMWTKVTRWPPARVCAEEPGNEQ
jgi:hypothetical protein